MFKHTVVCFVVLKVFCNTFFQQQLWLPSFLFRGKHLNRCIFDNCFKLLFYIPIFQLTLIACDNIIRHIYNPLNSPISPLKPTFSLAAHSLKIPTKVDWFVLFYYQWLCQMERAQSLYNSTKRTSSVVQQKKNRNDFRTKTDGPPNIKKKNGAKLKNKKSSAWKEKRIYFPPQKKSLYFLTGFNLRFHKNEGQGFPQASNWTTWRHKKTIIKKDSAADAVIFEITISLRGGIWNATVFHLLF